MRHTSFIITVPHSFSPISSFSAETKSYILILRFIVQGALQINRSNFFSYNIHTLSKIIMGSLFHNKSFENAYPA
jgi:hypothetical protein